MGQQWVCMWGSTSEQAVMDAFPIAETAMMREWHMVGKGGGRSTESLAISFVGGAS